MSKKENRRMYGNENDFLSYDESLQFPAGEETPEPTTRKGVVKKAPLVNLRKLPSGESRVIGFVEKETEFEILEVAEEWTKINYLGTHGWIMSQYVEEVS